MYIWLGGVKQLIKALFPITFSQWWFASTYFVLYLFHPYINILLKNLSKRQYQSYILLLVVLWSVLPTFTTSKFQSNQLCEFVLLYSISGYIRLFGVNSHKKKYWWVLSGFLWGVLFSSSVTITVLGTKYNFLSDQTFFFYKRMSLPMLMLAISLFMAFSNLKMGYHKYVNKVATATFGVYLLHDSNLLRTVLWQDIFHNADFANTNLLIIYSVVVSLSVYLICTLIDLFRQRFIEKGYMLVLEKYFEFTCVIFKKVNIGRNNN